MRRLHGGSCDPGAVTGGEHCQAGGGRKVPVAASGTDRRAVHGASRRAHPAISPSRAAVAGREVMTGAQYERGSLVSPGPVAKCVCSRSRPVHGCDYRHRAAEQREERLTQGGQELLQVTGAAVAQAQQVDTGREDGSPGKDGGAVTAALKAGQLRGEFAAQGGVQGVRLAMRHLDHGHMPVGLDADQGREFPPIEPPAHTNWPVSTQPNQTTAGSADATTPRRRDRGNLRATS